MSFQAFTRALLAAPPRERVLAMMPLLPAAQEAIEALDPHKEGLVEVHMTAELVERWARGGELDPNEVGFTAQLTLHHIDRLFESHHVEGGGNVACVLAAASLVQVALIEALGWDVATMLTMPVHDPRCDPPEDPAPFRSLAELDLSSETLAEQLILLEYPTHPALERAIAEIARRVGA